MAEFGVASGAVGIVSLGITVTQGLLAYYNSWKAAESDTEEMRSSLAALLKTLQLLKSSIENRKLDAAVVANVEQSITSCEIGLEKLRKKLDKIKVTPLNDGWREKAKSQLRKTTYHFEKETLVKLKEACDGLRNNLSLALTVLQIDVSTSSVGKLDAVKDQITHTSEGVNTLISVQEAEYNSRLYKWLSPLAGQFEDKQSETLDLPERQEGIVDELLATSEFNGWLSEEAKVLWCQGLPGAGKTVLASFVIKMLSQKYKQPDIAIAYVYCNYKEAETQTPRNLIADILRQISQQKSAIPSELKTLYDKNLREETRLSFEECSALLQAIVDEFSRVFIVIDALDECPEAHGNRDILLAEFRKLRSKISLFITSRYIPNLGNELSDAIKYEVRARDEDIAQYLSARISKSQNLLKFANRDPTLPDKITSAIVEKAQGMFLLARLHLEAVASERDLRSLKVALKNLPSSTNKTYDQAMERIKAQHDKDAALALKVLFWIFYAFRPLKVKELQHALAVQLGDTHFDEEGIVDKEDLVSICAGLVTIQEESQTMAMVHFSAQEYFKGECRAQTFFPMAQIEIARVCVMYLSCRNISGEEHDSTKLLERYKDDPVYFYMEVYGQYKYNFLLFEYAARHFFEHAKAAEKVTLIAHGQTIEMNHDIIRCLEKHKILIWAVCCRWNHYFSNFDYTLMMKVHPPLFYASLFGLQGVVKSLIDQKSDVNLAGSTYDDALVAASLMGHEHIVQLLFRNGAGLNVQDGGCGIALQAASFSGHEHIVQLLVREGVDVNVQGGEFGNALQAASFFGHEHIVQLLVREGVDVNVQCGKYGNALQAASRSGYEHIVQLLVREGVDVNVQYGEYGNALQAASFSGHEHIVQLLVREGVDVNVQCGEYGNALQAASFSGHEHIVQLLVREGVDVNVQCGEYGNALQAASYSGHEHIVQLLVREGVDVNVQGGKFGNALQAASRSGHEHIVQLLVREGVDVNVQCGKYGNTLQAASYCGHEQIVGFLLGKGANVNAIGGKYGSALAAASRTGHEQIVQMLWKNGAEMCAPGTVHNIALEEASHGAHYDVVRLLLHKGAVVNTQGKDLVAALTYDLEKQTVKTCQYLITAGSDVNARFDMDYTILQYAIWKHDIEVALLLLDAGAEMNTSGRLCGNLYLYYSFFDWLLQQDEEFFASEGLFGSALQAASFAGHGQIVRQLLQAGAHVNTKAGNHSTALQAASFEGCEDIVQTVLDKGANVNAEGGYLGTALQAASCGGHDRISEWLIQAGGVKVEQNGGYKEHLEGVRSDISDVSDVYRSDVYRSGVFQTELQLAAYQGSVAIVERLIKQGADVNAKGRYLGTALQTASYMGHSEVVETLLKAGAEVNAQPMTKDEWKRTLPKSDLDGDRERLSSAS